VTEVRILSILLLLTHSNLLPLAFQEWLQSVDDRGYELLGLNLLDTAKATENNAAVD
jgi:hypothetical protein